MRIFVTGNAGSGKSTLGRKLSAELGLPFYSLDKIVWQPGWKKTPPEECETQINALTRQNDWVIDGVAYEIQDEADIVIFLDMPRRLCFWRASRRSLKHLFVSRRDLPERCPEILIIPTLLKIIWHFPVRGRMKILAKAAQSPARFMHVRSNKELKRLHATPAISIALTTRRTLV